MNDSGRAGRSNDPEHDERDERDDGGRRRASVAYTVTGPKPVAYIEICDADGQVTRVFVPPGSTWRMATISLS